MKASLPGICVALVVAAILPLQAQQPGGSSSSAGLEQKVDAILKQMTLEEKIGLCNGDKGNFRGVPRLNIPRMPLCDGPRGPNGGGPSTAFPAGIMMGATWNPDLAYKAGQVMGNETRAAGIGMLLGPGVNIQRDPLGGRFFEYFSEDPYLNARLTVAIIKGIQSEGVAATVKHYACNNREWNRNFYMSMVDPRALNEIYLPAFKAAVEEAGVWAMMTSANGVNGDFVSDSRLMLNDTLRDRWKYDGIVITDWLQTRSTEKAALAGLDVSMPGGEDCGFGRPLLEAVKAGKVPEAVIDANARNVLRLYGRVGMLDNQKPRGDGAARNTPEHAQVARQVAEEGIVLLKNTRALLPLDADREKKVLVIGPNADQRFCGVGLGGSSWMQGIYEITPLAGITETLGKRVEYFSADDLGGYQPIPASALQTRDGKPGVAASYFAGGQGDPAVQRIEPKVDFMWEMRSPDQRIPANGFRAVFEGEIIPPATGTYTLRLVAGGEAKLFNREGGAPMASADQYYARPTAATQVNLEKGKPFAFRLEYQREPGDAAVRLEWLPPEASEESWKKLDLAAAQASSIIFVGGLDLGVDSEGRDRTSLQFPPSQERIINRLAKINPRTIVVLINGSPVELGGWLPNVPAVVEAWYPGMEGGHAIADVLFGRTNPSGRLPFTWPKKLADAPSQALGTQDKMRIDYKEGLFVGYRYYDSKDVEPEFPFGFGLSYTSFRIGPLKLTREQDKVVARATVRNTGARDGLVTVQFYVRPVHPSVERPVHELKAFQKIALKAGESAPVEFALKPDAFSFYNDKTNAWQFDPGEYELQAGLSSRDIPSRALIDLKD